MRAIGWSLVLVALSLGCGLDSGDGSGGPRPRRPADPGPGCAELESALRSCSLLTSGRFSECEGPSTDDERCGFNCIPLASCSDLSALFCGRRDFDELPPSAFSSCALACEPSVFVCGSGEQISSDAKCDDFQDCADGSDEFDCFSSQFVCFNSGFSIPESFVCDGGQDCPDGEDEADCGSSDDAFVCPEGFAIPREFVCDGNNDCGDLSDEQNCAPEANFICPDTAERPPVSPPR